MDWKELSADEAEKHPAYGFGGGLLICYALVVLWTLHSLYMLALDTNYALARWYGYENFPMVDFTSALQILLAIPILYLVPRKSPIMPSVAVSCLSVNWTIWFAFGMISPLAVPFSLTITAITIGIVLFLARSERVNVTYHRRVKAA